MCVCAYVHRNNPIQTNECIAIGIHLRTHRTKDAHT